MTNARAECLSSHHRLEHEGRPCIQAGHTETGHVLYGPYETIQPGRYQVEFLIGLGEIPPGRTGDFVCAVLDVAATEGRFGLMTRQVRVSELSERLTPIVVEFWLQEPRILEYRVKNTGQAGLVVAVSPKVTRLGDDPWPVHPRSSQEASWDNEAEFLDGYLRNVSGVLHVGANHGQERLFYQVMGLNVAWVEPIEEVYQDLVDNISGMKRQRAFKALLTDAEGQSVVFNIANNGGASSSILEFDKHAELFPDILYSERRVLTSTTLDGFMARNSLSTSDYQALTLDVEGAELMVLKGGQKALRDFHYVKCEVCDFQSRRGNPTSADLDAFLRPLGFEQLIRRAVGHGPGGNGTFWDIVWKRKGTGLLHRPGVSLPMIANEANDWEK